MTRSARRLLAVLALLALGAPVLAQAQNDGTADRYAKRRDGAFARLNTDLLIIRSRWAPSQFDQPSFTQNPSFYYFTGADHVLGALLVLDGKTRRAELFLPNALPGYLGTVTQGQPTATTASPSALHVDAVADWAQFAPYIDRRLAADTGLTLRLDDDLLDDGLAGLVSVALGSAVAPERPQSAWTQSIRQRWPNAKVVAGTRLPIAMRAVKDSGEIAILRRVAANSAAALLAGLGRFAPGARQRDVEAVVVETCTRLGDGPSFWPWVMTGPNAVWPAPAAAIVDVHNLDRIMRSGEVARFDMGCAADHYMGDVGRTVPVSATFTPGQAEVVDLLAAVYRAGLAVMRDGVTDTTIMRASSAEARKRMSAMRTTLGRRAASMIAHPDSSQVWQIHGIGLASAEGLPTVFRAGMVINFEPEFVVDGQGFYMEDMILVTPTGYEILTKGLPNTAAEIEQAKRASVRANRP
jgi:Xaa-Pro aminopeptidase